MSQLDPREVTVLLDLVQNSRGVARAWMKLDYLAWLQKLVERGLVQHRPRVEARAGRGFYTDAHGNDLFDGGEPAVSERFEVLPAGRELAARLAADTVIFKVGDAMVQL